MMYIKSTEYRYAVDCLRTSLENYPSNLETMALLGEAILRLAQETEDAELYAEAIGVLQDTVEKQEILTKRARSLRHLGDAHSAQGNGEQAIQCYTLSLELVSEQIGTLINLATALKSVGRVEEARKALGKAANLIPQDPHELIDLGRVWLERGEVEKAVQFIHRGMNHEKASQEDVCLYEKAIDALLEHGLVWEAAPLIDVVSKQRPDFYNALGMAFVKPKPVKGQLVEPRNRDFSQAIQAYTKALELDHTGDRYAYLHNRGMAYYKSDQIDLAELDFKQAYALNPNSATKKMLNTIKLDRKR
jgi:tetratricopeptide (TPR) repeat protein